MKLFQYRSSKFYNFHTSFIVVFFHVVPLILFSDEVSTNNGFLDLGISVVDVMGNPMDDVEIRVEFSGHNRDGEWFTRKHTVRSNSDTPVRLRERAVGTTISIERDGYWSFAYMDSWLDARHPENGQSFPETRKDIVIELREQKNPRPLFVNRIERLLLYEMGIKYGYDLERGDLVRPYGNGVRADIFLSMEGEVNAETREFDVVMTLSFPNKDDGIIPVVYTTQGSNQLLLGHEAPEDGYQPTYTLRVTGQGDGLEGIRNRKFHPSTEEQKTFEGFWFRTHTVLDTVDGSVLQARHGKIYNDFHSVFSFNFLLATARQQQAWLLRFNYFYAPDHSRSLEFNGETLVPNGNTHGVIKR